MNWCNAFIKQNIADKKNTNKKTVKSLVNMENKKILFINFS